MNLGIDKNNIKYLLINNKNDIEEYKNLYSPYIIRRMLRTFFNMYLQHPKQSPSAINFMAHRKYKLPEEILFAHQLENVTEKANFNAVKDIVWNIAYMKIKGLESTLERTKCPVRINENGTFNTIINFEEFIEIYPVDIMGINKFIVCQNDKAELDFNACDIILGTGTVDDINYHKYEIEKEYSLNKHKLIDLADVKFNVFSKQEIYNAIKIGVDNGLKRIFVQNSIENLPDLSQLENSLEVIKF